MGALKHEDHHSHREKFSPYPENSSIRTRLYPGRRKEDRRGGEDRRSGKDPRSAKDRRVEQVPIDFPDRRRGGDRRNGKDRRTGEERRRYERRKRRLRIPIFLKLAFMSTLLILLIISTISLLVLGRQKAQFVDQLIDLGKSVVRITALNAGDKLLGEEDVSLFKLVNDIAKNEAFLFALITDHRNIIRAHSRIDLVGKPYSMPESMRLVREEDGVRASLMRHAGSEVLYLEMPVLYQKLKAGEVRLAISQEGIVSNIRRAKLFILMLTVGITLMGILLSLGLSVYFSHPIKKLGESTRALGIGDFEHRVKISRNDEFGDLAYAFNRMAEDLGLSEKIKGSFGRYITPEIVDLILANPDDQWMKGARVEASVLFVDIRGFATLSDDKEPERIVDLLNAYFTRITEVVIRNGGHLNKFVGDEAMVVFGAPAPKPRHGEAAVRAALEIRAEIERLNREKSTSDVTIQVGIGINSGEMVAGNLGSPKRMEYTMIGDNVNVASRLTSIAKPGEILISKGTLDLMKTGRKPITEEKGKIPIKGRRMEIEVFGVIGWEGLQDV